MASLHNLHQRVEAADLTTIQAARVVSALVTAGVPFDFLPAHLTGRPGHSVAVPAKHTVTLEAAVTQATSRIPTVGTGATA